LPVYATGPVSTTVPSLKVNSKLLIGLSSFYINLATLFAIGMGTIVEGNKVSNVDIVVPLSPSQGLRTLIAGSASDVNCS
jgi:hypothetical protein